MGRKWKEKNKNWQETKGKVWLANAAPKDTTRMCGTGNPSSLKDKGDAVQSVHILFNVMLLIVNHFESYRNHESDIFWYHTQIQRILADAGLSDASSSPAISIASIFGGLRITRFRRVVEVGPRPEVRRRLSLLPPPPPPLLLLDGDRSASSSEPETSSDIPWNDMSSSLPRSSDSWTQTI